MRKDILMKSITIYIFKINAEFFFIFHPHFFDCIRFCMILMLDERYPPPKWFLEKKYIQNLTILLLNVIFRLRSSKLATKLCITNGLDYEIACIVDVFLRIPSPLV